MVLIGTKGMRRKCAYLQDQGLYYAVKIEILSTLTI